MKKTYLISLLLMSFSVGFSQEYSVDWGPEYRKEGGLFSFFYMAGMTADNYHLIMQPRRNKTLLTFDTDHKLVKNQGIDIKIEGNELDFRQFIQTSTGTYALFNNYNKRRREWSMYVGAFNNNKLADPELVFKHSFESKRFLGINFRPYFFNSLELSSNNNFVSFVNEMDLKAKGENAKFTITTFDQNMNLLWDKVQEINYSDEDLELVQTVVSNKGEVYLLAKIDKRDPRAISISFGGDWNPEYSYKVFKITETNVEEFDIQLDNNLLVVDAGIFLPENDIEAFLIGGFYTSEEKRSGLNGLFLVHVNKESESIKSSTHPLEADFSEGLISKRDQKKDRGLNTSFTIDDLLVFADGSFAFIAEEYYITTSQYIDSQGNWQTKMVYNSDQIVIPRFTKEGELLNVEKIEKSFSSSMVSAVSYSIAMSNGKIFLLYTDSKNREERRELKGRGNSGGYYTDMTVIGENGNIEFQETMFSSKDSELVFLPSESEYNNDHLIILGISGFGGKKYKCGTIDLR